MTGFFARRLQALLCAALLLALPATAFAQTARGPLVLAAASLQDALTVAADEWARQGHPRPSIAFAGSSALARQIESGAPADLFVSADEEWMTYLSVRKLVDMRSRAVLATNRLVLVAPASSTMRLAIAPRFPLARALGQGRLAMASPDGVPAGKYGKQALTALMVWPSVKDRLAPTENVRAALALVARGEALLGIVYATDAAAEPRVRVLGVFPATSHKRIAYPVARIAGSANPEAERFRRFLLSSRCRQIFARFGFGAP